MSADNIILDSCQYTPVYFIENPGVSQARSYIVQPNNQSVDTPVGESLKRFYENSGKLEYNLNSSDSTSKPKIIKKNDVNSFGNNLKLASFLLPKCETKNEVKPMLAPMNSVVLKPVYIANNFSVNNVNNNVISPNQVPKLDVDSRLVNLKDFPNIVLSQDGKILPKIKPKENSPSTKQKQTAVPIQPVQLVKFGETYHSVNQLNSEQMKLVNHALKMLNNTQTPPLEPAYDPATNTKFVYKVITHKDFAEKSKVNKQVIADIKKEATKIEKHDISTEDAEEMEPKFTETKMTNSGRLIKVPKNLIMDDSSPMMSPRKPKKRLDSILACLQCNSKFSSAQRLQRHYENHPTHLSTKLHGSLYHCLIAIVSAGSEDERASILLQQLKEFIHKLRSCAPCLLKCGNGGKENMSVVNQDVSRLLGITPGKYNLNMEALGCVKDSDGYCSHNPRLQISVTDNIKPLVKLENINSIAKSPKNVLKVNFQDRRPTILRKVECRKQKLEPSGHNDNGKKIKLSQDIHIDKKNIELDDLVALLSDTTKTDINESKVIDTLLLNGVKEVKQETVPKKSERDIRPPHLQFHSAHFDIRSSPIKTTSTVFRKFQINPEKMTKYIEVIKPIQLNQLANTGIKDKVEQMNNINTQGIFSNSNLITSKHPDNLNYTTKNWCEDTSFMKPSDLMTNPDNFLQTNSVTPALLHIQNGAKATQIANDSVIVENNSELANAVNNKYIIKSNMFIEKSINVRHDCKAINTCNDYMTPHILIEPLTVARDKHKLIENKVGEIDDFIKSDMIMEQSLLNTEDCKVLGDVNDRNDYMKSNVLIEPSLLQSTKEFSDPTNSFITPSVYSDPTLNNNENSVMDVTQNNDIDELNSSQGQSIMSFLESLGNELAYTETDSRNNSVDFQLDLF